MQAIPTALEMWGQDITLLVVSFAPPPNPVERVPSGVLKQFQHWMGNIVRLDTQSGEA